MNRIENIDFDHYAEIGVTESQHIVKLSEFTTSIADRFTQGIDHFGDALPWQKTHDKFRLRPGEVTVWAGINGHGKSLLTSQVASHLLRHTSCIIASLEMPVAATGHRMLRQIIGNPSPTREFIRRAISWTSNNLWLYDQLDTVPAKRIIGMCVYAITELGIRHVFIDSLMKCGIRHDDYQGQEAFVDRLCWIAKHYDVHIHLIHHMRKGASENDRPGKFDLKGSGGITDLVDNVVIMHRNKSKERKQDISDEEDQKIPDATVTVDKQRHGEWEGVFNFWFHNSSHQFLAWKQARPDYFDLGIDNVIERAQAG